MPIGIYIRTEEHNKKISKALLGIKRKPHTEERKKAMSKKFSGSGNPFYGRKHTVESKEKISRNNAWKGISSNRKGSKHSKETRLKLSRSMKMQYKKGLRTPPCYIDGRTSVNCLIRSSVEYKLWREAVFGRDNYTCQKCKARSGNGKAVFLEAHHIKPFSLFPELRFVVSNGITFCEDCHKEIDNYIGRPLK